LDKLLANNSWIKSYGFSKDLIKSYKIATKNKLLYPELENA
jgi:hypothetical protein